MRATARVATATVLTLIGAIGLTGPAQAAAGEKDDLEVYTGTVNAEQVEELRAIGVDGDHLTLKGGATEATATVEAVLSEQQADRLASKGLKLKPKEVDGKPVSEVLRAQAKAGWTAFRSYSEPGGIRDEITATAARFPGLTEVQTIGRTVQGQPILALRITKDAKKVADGKRPSVLYASSQHAREWITPEMTRRLFHYYLDNYGTDPEVTKLVDTTELWFLPVANPDGYDYTFTEGNRLWRKNLRDNNGDGKITPGDGVDLNRNFSYKWGYDNEGSSTDPAGETYRGTGPNSEPETKALDGLFKRVGFEYFINYHSAAELLLYGIGWQVSTPSPDDVIYETLAGDDAHPAIPGYDPDISAELYTTNGDTDMHAAVNYGTLGFTPEMSTCTAVSESIPDDEWDPADCASDFIFPDDEELIQAEFEKNLPFALSVAKSTKDPDNPVSVVGRTTPDFVIDPFEVSFGKEQQVAAITRRSLAHVTLNYKVNGGPTKTKRAKEWKGGERYGDVGNDYYAELRGEVTSQKAGDTVEVWFTGEKDKKKVESSRFTYKVSADIGGDVLVLAAEDVTGVSPAQGVASAKYADEHVASLNKAGYSTDVYDFDLQGRKAPHHLGVLSHYKAVVWETGDDIILRNQGQPAGTTAKAALDTELNIRDYLNEGGKLLVGGQYALYAQAANGSYAYNPAAPPECTDAANPACLGLFNDFQQYYLGAYTYVSDGGTNGATHQPYPLVGLDGKFEGFNATLNAEGSAKNQTHTASFLNTSSFLPVEQFPQFASEVPVGWERPGAAPFDPLTGDYYVYGGQNSASYKRLTNTVTVPAGGAAQLQFATSFDTEADWDYLFVEAHRVGQDDWTTLPELNGHTSTETGESCNSGWNSLHPFISHYQTQNGATCTPTGTTGSWNAASGPSGGWQNWAFDLSAYAGSEVEVSITYVTDWSTLGLGVFVDDAKFVVNGADVEATSFEDGLGGWAVPGPPAGSSVPTQDWLRTQKAFDEGAVVTTPDTVYLGFGLEGLAPLSRDELVKRAMQHLKIKP